MTVNVKDSTGATVPLKSSTESAEEVPHHAISTANGAGATIGFAADAVVSTDTTGTLSAKLRGIVKILNERLPSALGGKTPALSLSITKPSDTSFTGSFTAAAQTITATVGQGESIIAFQVTGTFVATTVLEGSVDGGTTWVVLPFYYLVSGTVQAQQTSINFVAPCFAPIGGFSQIRLRCSAYTSGTMNITGRTSQANYAHGTEWNYTTSIQVATLNSNMGDQIASANVTGTIGTISGKLRGIVQLLAAAIDITNLFMRSQLVPFTSGGLSNYHVVSAGSTNTVNIKASAGQVYGWSMYNNAAYSVYVKLHNTAGTPTAGSGVVKTIALPAGGGSNRDSDIGMAFAAGIGISIVKDITDAGTTAVLASDCVVDIEYK